MNYLKFVICEFVLFSLFITLNYFYDGYLNPPFTSVDLIATIIALPIFVGICFLLLKLYKRFDTISFWKKIILSVPSFILSGFVIDMVVSYFFSI